MEEQDETRLQQVTIYTAEEAVVHHIRMVVQVVQVGLTEYLALQIHLGQVVQVGLLPLVQHQQEVAVVVVLDSIK